MQFLTKEEYVASFYKDLENNPDIPFPLAKEGWKNKYKEMFNHSKKMLISGSIITLLIAWGVSSILVSLVEGEGNKGLTLLAASTMMVIVMIGIPGVIIYIMATNPSTLNGSEIFPDYEKTDIPKSFISALKSWIEAKYDYDFSDQNIKEIIQRGSTVRYGDTYKVIYSHDNDHILGLLSDN